MEMSKGNLKGYSLSYLRLLAREIGVKSPTSLRKDELINKIIDVSNGTVFPTSVNSGRPPLKVYEIERKEIVDKKVISNLKRVKKACDTLSREINDFLKSIENND